MAMTPGKTGRAGPVVLVLAIVLLQLAAAWVLDHAADRRAGLIVAAAAIVVAIGLNLGRFVLWGYAHRRYPLSHIYPLTALFFPCILILSYFQGDVVGATEILGTVLITAGAVIMSVGKTSREPGND